MSSPAVRSATSQTGQQGERASPDQQCQILLVDDRPENLLALEAILGDVGQELISVTSGKEALRLLLNQEFAVILLDVNMPEMDGFETATLIRMREHSQSTPIIFLTALDKGDAHVFKGYSVGAVDYIFKPIDADILRAKVRVFIDLYQKSQEIKRLNQTLERRVEERTQELEQANQELRREIAERKRAEAAIRTLNASLEQRVRERTAELEAANRELKAFSYSVSHDLRAPLRKIEAFSKVLLEDHVSRLDPVGRNYLKRICQASQRMSELIDDMLKLSRITGDEMSREQINLSEIVENIAAELRSTQPDRHVTFHVQKNLVAYGDLRLLQLALQNLLENAWKFTQHQPQAVISFGTTDDPEGPEYFVQDNGAGFDMAHAEHLFQPFQRMHSANEFPGTGIGLAIVQRVIRRHGGRIRAEATVDQGATFYFTLPS